MHPTLNLVEILTNVPYDSPMVEIMSSHPLSTILLLFASLFGAVVASVRRETSFTGKSGVQSSFLVDSLAHLWPVLLSLGCCTLLPSPFLRLDRPSNLKNRYKFRR